MNDIYIAEKPERILSRVTLKLGDNQVYIIESPYSDADLIEMGLDCIESCLHKYGISEEEFANLLVKILKKEHIPYDKKYVDIPNSQITFIFEQYDKRNIVTNVSFFNIIEGLVECLKSCAILTTYSEVVVNKIMLEYIEGFGIDTSEFYPEEDSVLEETE